MGAIKLILQQSNADKNRVITEAIKIGERLQQWVDVEMLDGSRLQVPIKGIHHDWLVDKCYMLTCENKQLNSKIVKQEELEIKLNELAAKYDDLSKRYEQLKELYIQEEPLILLPTQQLKKYE